MRTALTKREKPLLNCRCRCWDNMKWIFKKYSVRLRTGLNWILYSGRPFWSGNETCDFMQGLGIS